MAYKIMILKLFLFAWLLAVVESVCRDASREGPLCRGWKRVGFCNEPKRAVLYCKRTCGLCESATEGSRVTTRTKPTWPACTRFGRYGCCDDRRTFSANRDGTNCPGSTKRRSEYPEPQYGPACSRTKHGCCNDRQTVAKDNRGSNCLDLGNFVEITPTTRKPTTTTTTTSTPPTTTTVPTTTTTTTTTTSTTPTTSTEYPIRSGLPPCTRSRFGCCDDGRTIVVDIYKSNCPESIHLISGPACSGSTYGCCPDKLTAARDASKSNCRDVCRDSPRGDKLCQVWQIRGFCYLSQAKTYCRKTCGFCTGDDEDFTIPPRLPVRPENVRGPNNLPQGKDRVREIVDSMREEIERARRLGVPDCAVSRHGCCWDNRTVAIDSVGTNCPGCVDVASRLTCSSWISGCESRNEFAKGYQRRRCPVTCGVPCDFNWNVNTCRDDSSVDCLRWYINGWCDSQFSIMQTLCPLTCGWCGPRDV